MRFFRWLKGFFELPEAQELRPDPKSGGGRYVRSFLVWSRMPIVIRIDGRAYLTDQRFYGDGRRVRKGFFLVPLDKQ